MNKIFLDKKSIIISSICFVFFIILSLYIFMDGIGGFAADGVSGFIEQSNLQKTLGPWYQLIFYTFQINLIFCISGMLYFFFSDKQFIKNLMFSSSSFLIFCLFAMLVFNFDSFQYNPYESSKTIFVHLIIPTSSLIIIFLLRKEIILNIKTLFMLSLYMTFYLILSLIIYYNINFSYDVDNDLAGKKLWIYGFLDFDNQILFIPTNIHWFKILLIVFWISISPTISFCLFLLLKYSFNIKTNINNTSTELIKEKESEENLLNL